MCICLAAAAYWLAVIVYRILSWESFKTAVVRVVRTTSMVMILVASAGAFAYMLTVHQVSARVIPLMTGIAENPVAVLLMLNLVLLVLGTIMDMTALILICTPIFLAVFQSFGMDPLQFVMILMMNLGLGPGTPPVGACPFVGQGADREGGDDDLAVLSCHPGGADVCHLCPGRVAHATGPDRMR